MYYSSLLNKVFKNSKRLEDSRVVFLVSHSTGMYNFTYSKRRKQSRKLQRSFEKLPWKFPIGFNAKNIYGFTLVLNFIQSYFFLLN